MMGSRSGDAGVGRGSPLRYTIGNVGIGGPGLGLAGDRRSGTLAQGGGRRRGGLGLAGDRRSGTLPRNIALDQVRWGWPGIAAQVHCSPASGSHAGSWGWPGIAAQVHYGQRFIPLAGCWGWPGIAAQVHCVPRNPLGCGGIPAKRAKKAKAGRALAQGCAAFWHKKPPSSRTGGR